MLLSLSTLASPSTLSRLNFFPKPPSLFSALSTFRRNQLPLKSSFTETVHRNETRRRCCRFGHRNQLRRHRRCCREKRR
ncbi:hypothetical protein AAZX31_01G127800 [Glycine max]